MKTKIISVITTILLVVGSMSIISCGSNGDNNSSVQESHNHDHVEYQCPMDCEEGKTYDKEGNCPVCGMELKEV